jgi:hypothetical protein
MGAMNPSKMGNKKTVTRKDNPNKVAMYASGGKTHGSSCGKMKKTKKAY